MPRKPTQTDRSPANRRTRSAAANSAADTPLRTLFRVRKPSSSRRSILSRSKPANSGGAADLAKQSIKSPNQHSNTTLKSPAPLLSPTAAAPSLTTPPRSAVVATRLAQQASQPATPKDRRQEGPTLPSPADVSPLEPSTPKRRTPRLRPRPKVQQKLQFDRRKTPAPIRAPPPDLPTTPLTGGSLRDSEGADDDEFVTLAPCSESDEEFDDDVVDVRPNRLIAPADDPLISHVLQLFPEE